ncbi:serine/threonine-protein kinase [Nocardioides insulae]|uniref:serine/threonine-protein kinase n=1 Tax=Nocardioides insulae TaxID=394734 RepID=UPI0004047EEB|nr:serine/threonine-protein kinase [Nocardioides insulae]
MQVFGGRYELLDPIAEGGMGSVWRVHDRKDGQVKAAKLLRQIDASSLLRFMREQSTRIHHPHVVTPMSWAGEDDVVLFTMPLVRGGSVAGLITTYGALPEPWVSAVLDQLLAGLAAVHEAGVVHRDVKPANLLLEPTGAARPIVRLTDFGIAAPLGEPRLTRVSQSVGTTGYMAPEVELGAEPDPAQDVYGAATVGLEMLTGRRPPFDLGSGPVGRLQDLLVTARAEDPARRPTVAQFREALGELATAGSWDPAGVFVADQFAAPGAPSGPSGPPPSASGPRPSSGPRSGPLPGPVSGPPSGPRRPTRAETQVRAADEHRSSLLLPMLLAGAGLLLLLAAIIVVL